MADNLFSKWIDSLDRTRKASFGRIATFLGTSEINADTWEELEALLIQADLGVDTTLSILAALKKQVSEQGVTRSEDFATLLETELLGRLSPVPELDLSHDPTVIFLVGVNGSGKTTTAAKLGKLFSNNGKKVLLVAADTFRAAAIDQLQVWAERLNLALVSSQPESDPGAVTFDGIQSALARKYDVVLVDTPAGAYPLQPDGRVEKVYRVAGKALPGAPHLVLLVLDAPPVRMPCYRQKHFNRQ
jgi:fused signal recognition particle receptor